jgi:glycosyltransferase involved in cell wall biosynthesis
MKPKFSVLLPVYNGSKYMHKAINSVLKQNYQNFELVISDDKSLDNSFKIAKYYQKKDKRVQLIQQNINYQLGWWKGFNNWMLALKKSQGEYVFFIGHDDILSKNYLFDLNKNLDKSTSLFFGSIVQIDKSNNIYNHPANNLTLDFTNPKGFIRRLKFYFLPNIIKNILLFVPVKRNIALKIFRKLYLLSKNFKSNKAKNIFYEHFDTYYIFELLKYKKIKSFNKPIFYKRLRENNKKLYVTGSGRNKLKNLIKTINFNLLFVYLSTFVEKICIILFIPLVILIDRLHLIFFKINNYFK